MDTQLLFIEYRLCKEFGWTPQMIEEMPAKKIEEFVLLTRAYDEKEKREADLREAMTR